MKRPFVFFPAIDYTSLYQRPQHLASLLVKRGFPVYFRNVGQVGGREPIVIDGVNTYHDWDRRPTEIDDDAIYIIYYPSFTGYRHWDKNEFVIYDCVDDFPDFEPYQEHACNAADLIVYTNDKIKESIGKLDLIREDKPFLRLTNGVGSGFGDNVEIADEMKHIKNRYTKVLGFVGAMHYSWVDVDLLHRLANEHPEWAIVIIGSTYAWDFRMSQAPSNLIRLGTKKYEELASYYRGCDVGLISFLDNQISQGSDPIKLYEYAACEVPVVSRDLIYCKDIGQPVCYKYTNYDECVVQIKKALDDNCQDNKALRRYFASGNTWEKRVDKLLEKISELTWLEN